MKLTSCLLGLAAEQEDITAHRPRGHRPQSPLTTLDSPPSARESAGARFWRGTASAPELYNLLARFLGAAAADEAFRQYAATRGRRWPDDPPEVDAELVHFVEVQLAVSGPVAIA